MERSEVGKMIKRQIMSLLKEKTGKSLSRIYQMIESRQKSHAVTRETAAYLLAMEYDINVAKYLSPDELAEVRGVKLPVIVKLPPLSHKVPPSPRIVRIEPSVDIEVPNLPSRVVNEAKDMSRVYPYIYLFENSVRYLIKDIMERNYSSDWWEERAPSETKKTVYNRLEKEDIHRWHAQRGKHSIFYSDIRDLLSIIRKNWEDFKDIFPDQPWVKSLLDSIELSRNIVAHNNPLPKDEITRLKLDLKAWVKQISKLKKTNKS